MFLYALKFTDSMLKAASVGAVCFSLRYNLSLYLIECNIPVVIQFSFLCLYLLYRTVFREKCYSCNLVSMFSNMLSFTIGSKVRLMLKSLILFDLSTASQNPCIALILFCLTLMYFILLWFDFNLCMLI